MNRSRNLKTREDRLAEAFDRTDYDIQEDIFESIVSRWLYLSKLEEFGNPKKRCLLEWNPDGFVSKTETAG